jgi:hypothetical protein
MVEGGRRGAERAVGAEVLGVRSECRVQVFDGCDVAGELADERRHVQIGGSGLPD